MIILSLKHDIDSDAPPQLFKYKNRALDEVEDFYKSYDFEMRDGKLYDTDREGEEGFECFTGVKFVNGRVASFVHCDGQGPVVTWEEARPNFSRQKK